MMRFAMLGSGSKGNASVFQAGDTCVLLDTGFAAAETTRRLKRLGLEPDDLDAIIVTHEHSDHLGGVGPFARRHGLPVWLTAGTLAQWNDPVADCRIFSPHEAFAIGDLQVEPYPVPHDAREPCQYVLGDGARRVGVLSDAGSVTVHMRAMLDRCDALLLECNHDDDQLANGPYPPALKRRVAGTLGHLSNVQAAGLLRLLDCSRLQHLALIHLSETNNSPDLARAAVTAALDCDPDWLACAEQETGLGWRNLK